MATSQEGELNMKILSFIKNLRIHQTKDIHTYNVNGLFHVSENNSPIYWLITKDSFLSTLWKKFYYRTAMSYVNLVLLN